jgi:hypothetical protein
MVDYSEALGDPPPELSGRGHSQRESNRQPYDGDCVVARPERKVGVSGATIINVHWAAISTPGMAATRRIASSLGGREVGK